MSNWIVDLYIIFMKQTRGKSFVVIANRMSLQAALDEITLKNDLKDSA
jgi:hypothetical protein